MVAYLNKSDASEDFDQIIDFLNESYIKYALTINPHIYVSCIKQFWNIVVVKQSNDITRLQALVDKKKVVITEATIRDAIRLVDAEGVDFLPNEEIFAELAQEQVQDDIDDAAAQGADTAVEGDVVHEPSIPSPTPPNPPPQQSQDLPSIYQEALDACAALARRVGHLEYDKVAQALEITKLKRRVKQLERGNKVKILKLRRLKKPEVQEVVDVVTTAKLITKVVTAASITIAATEPQVPATTLTAALDKGKGIMVEEPKPIKKKQQVEMDEEYARKLHEELNKDIDWDVAIDHVKQKAKEDLYVQRYQSKEQIEDEENRAIQSINETPAQKAAKKRKLNEEVEDHKQYLEIVPDEDDDVYT
nr:xylulose kinase-1 [Tanacetum cinerariifolium]